MRILLISAFLAIAVVSVAHAQNGVDLYGVPGAGQNGNIGTGMGGFHGTGTGGGFYHPSWGPSMPGYWMPREKMPTLPPFDGNPVRAVTPFAPMSKISMTGGATIGINQRPQFGADPQFNYTPHAAAVGSAPRYTPGFSASPIGGGPAGAQPNFNALPNDARGSIDVFPRRDSRPPTNPSWPNAVNPRWWPQDLAMPVQNENTVSTGSIGQRPWPDQ
jgi:opacity protein-like surface antigen